MSGIEPDMEDLFQEKKRVRNPLVSLEFLGSLCKCANKGGSLRSNNGPWNDPEIVELVHHMEVNTIPQTTKAPLHIRDHGSATPPKETLKEEPDTEEHYHSSGSRCSMYTCLAPSHSDEASTPDGDKFITTTVSRRLVSTPITKHDH